MKFFLIIVYIFFFLINSILVNDTQLSSCSESFDINSYQMNENEKENNNTDEIILILLKPFNFWLLHILLWLLKK